MKYNHLLAAGLMACAPGLATAAEISLGTATPPVGEGVQNLSFSTSAADNTAHDFVDADYIASDVNGGEALWVGQGFTAPSEAAFYQLNSISVRQVSWGPTNWDFDGGQVSLRFFRVDSQDGAIYDTTEVAAQTVNVADATTTTIAGTPTDPQWLTFEFTTPLLLTGGAEYAFAFNSNATIDGATNNFLMEVDGTNTDVYAGGCSITVPAGTGALWKGGADNDRAFVANMVEYTATGDSDVDGLPDSWELSWPDVFDLTDLNGTKTGPGPGFDTGDFDNDGETDLEEYNGGTDPTDETSFTDTEPDGLPDNWENGIAGNLTDLDGTLAAGSGPGAGTGDFDGDGYSDLEEYESTDEIFDLGRSNPIDAASTPVDRDGDGLTDEWEILYFFFIFETTGDEDYDGDFDTNAAEEAAGTDPTNPADFVDSEPDGISDGWEQAVAGNITDLDGTLPAGSGPGAGTGDFDGDGFSDLEEYQSDPQSDPTVAASTPLDTDGDGLSDAWEIANFGSIEATSGEDDWDGDFDTNAAEEANGTDPDDADDFTDSEPDGLADGWELLFAGNLTDLDGTLPAGSGPGAGTGDFDGDGSSDLEERTYLTDPTDDQSVPVKVISVNYNIEGSVTPPLDPLDEAGAVSAVNWNNVTGLNHAITFADNGMVDTSVTVALSGGGLESWNTAFNPDEDIFGDKVTIYGPPLDLTLTDVPYDSYDLYLYMSSWGSEVVEFSLDGGSTVVATLTNMPPNPNDFLAGNEYRLNDTYVKISGLTGDAVVTMTNVVDWVHLAGFQIVDRGALPAVPEFVQQPQDATAFVGRSFSLPAVAISNPAPGYQWQYSPDDSTYTDLSDGGSISGATTGTLVIDPVATSDEGYYQLVADNGTVVISDAAFITVEYPDPAITDQPDTQSLFPGDLVNLTVIASGVNGLLDLTYQWYKVDGGGDIPLTDDGTYFGTDTANLQIPDVSVAEEGQYYVIITDSAPESEALPATTSTSAVATITVGDLAVTGGTTPPVVNGGDISWFPANPETLTDADNVADEAGLNAGDDANTYIAGDRPSQGMSFTTGDNGVDGFVLKAITVQQVQYTPTFWNVQPGQLFQIAIGSLDGTTKTEIYSSTKALYTGDGFPGTSGNFLTFDLTGAAISLASNSQYYFEIASGAGAPLLELSGTNVDNYAGGAAFSGNATAQLTPDAYVTRTGDRAFHVDVTTVGVPENDFASWIAGFDVGDLDGFNDDADGDGLTNGTENFFGTDPSLFSEGVTEPRKVGNTFVFEHPENPMPASDVLAAYTWSLDLAAWLGDGETSAGTTVNFTAVPDTPATGTTTVTATFTGTVPDDFFTGVEVTQAAP